MPIINFCLTPEFNNIKLDFFEKDDGLNVTAVLRRMGICC